MLTREGKVLGKQYLLNVLQSANINPGCTMTSQVSKMDYQRQHRNVRSGKGSRLELQEGTVYESGITLSVNPELINAASI